MAFTARPDSGAGFAGLPSSERVYGQLKDAIVTGELEPGARVVEAEVARLYDVSRTPVREALKRLLAERLVERDAASRVIVRRAEPGEFDEAFSLREVLDGLATRLAARRVTAEDVIKLTLIHKRFTEAAEEDDAEACASINISFHDAIYATGGNRLLARLSVDLRDFVRQFSAGAAYFAGRRMHDAVQEHGDILTAIEARDAAQAEQAARHHIRNSARHHVLTSYGKDESA